MASRDVGPFVTAVPDALSGTALMARRVVSRILHVMARFEVTGLENVPTTGACLIVFNQLSILDTPLVRVVIPRLDVTGLVARSYRDNWFFRFLIEAGGGIWIRRGAGDRVALETSLEALRRGWIVAISPEGRRSRTGGLIRAKPGVAFLAYRAGVPILPMTFTNTARIVPALKRLRRTTVSIRIGKPFALPPLGMTNRRRQRQDAADLIMGRLARLLPPEYRGVYPGCAKVVNGLRLGRPEVTPDRVTLDREVR